MRKNHLRQSIYFVVLTISGVFFTPRAMADECEAGKTKCGEFCHPTGRVCCENLGRTELSCTQGTTCVLQNGEAKCAEGCEAGEEACALGCFDPKSQVCCGSSGVKCPIGHICQENAQGITCQTKSADGCSTTPDEPNDSTLFVIVFAGILSMVL